MFAELHKNRDAFYWRSLVCRHEERVVFEEMREKGKEVRGASLQFRFHGSLLCKWIMVLQRLAGFPRIASTLLLPKGSSLTARRRVRWESYGSGEIEANWRAQHGFEVAGASRASNAEQWELSSISLGLNPPFLALPSLYPPRSSPFRLYAHPSLDTRSSIQGYLTLCWLGRFRRGNNRAGYPTPMKAVLMNRREREVLIRTLSYSSHIITRFNDTVATDERLSARINYAKKRSDTFIFLIYSDTINKLQIESKRKRRSPWIICTLH